MPRPLVENTPRVDVRALVRAARGGRGGPRSARLYRPRSDGTWARKGTFRVLSAAGGELWALPFSIAVDGSRGAVSLSLRGRLATVLLEGERVHLGGARWFARCGCGVRCAVLFLRGEHVGCRRCLGLVHASTRSRSLAAASDALVRRLGRVAA